MSLVIRYWIGDVQDSQGVSASEMTYIVSGGALNSTHSPVSINCHIPFRRNVCSEIMVTVCSVRACWTWDVNEILLTIRLTFVHRVYDSWNAIVIQFCFEYTSEYVNPTACMLTAIEMECIDYCMLRVCRSCSFRILRGWHDTVVWWSAPLMASELWWRGRGFDSRQFHSHAVALT